MDRHIFTHDKSGYVNFPGCNKAFRPDFLKEHLNAKKNLECFKVYNGRFALLPDNVQGHEQNSSGADPVRGMPAGDLQPTTSTRIESASAMSVAVGSPPTGRTSNLCRTSDQNTSNHELGVAKIRKPLPAEMPSALPTYLTLGGRIPPAPYFDHLQRHYPDRLPIKPIMSEATVIQELPDSYRPEADVQLKGWNALVNSLQLMKANTSVQQRIRVLSQSNEQNSVFPPSQHAVGERRLCQKKVSKLNRVKKHALRHISHPLELTVSCEGCNVTFVFEQDLRLHKSSQCPDDMMNGESFISECGRVSGNVPTRGNMREKFLADLRIWERLQHFDNLIQAADFVHYWANRPLRPAYSMQPPRATYPDIVCKRASSSIASVLEIYSPVGLMANLSIQGYEYSSR